jgi:hypothetical protein
MSGTHLFIIIESATALKKREKMKIVDEYHTIDNKKIKFEIETSVELLRDLTHMNHNDLDDYTKYRMLKALDKIETFNKKIK